MIRETRLHKSMSRQIGCVKPANPKLSLIYKCGSMAGMRSKNLKYKTVTGPLLRDKSGIYLNGELQKAISTVHKDGHLFI